MIVFAALTPHTPLLLPNIGKIPREKMIATVGAMDVLAQELSVAEPDTIVIISAHSTIFPNAFSINLHDHYQVDLKEFGDLSTRQEFLPDLWLIDQIQRASRKKQIPLTLNSDAALDYGSAVPLVILTEHLPRARVVPISYSGLPLKDHFLFGQELKDVFLDANKRIAVIASGDLSHALSEEAPGGKRKEGEKFDAVVRESVTHMLVSQLLQIEPEVVEKAMECGQKSLLMLFGILDGINARSEALSYEAPFGVGYLVAKFEI